MRGFAEVPPTVIAVSFSSKRASSDLTAVNRFFDYFRNWFNGGF